MLTVHERSMRFNERNILDDAFFCVMFVLERAVRVYIYNVTWRGGA